MINVLKIFKSRKNLSVIAGIIFFLLIIIAVGSIGFYSIYKSYIDSAAYVDSIDSAREVQVLMGKQFMTWNKIVLEGNNPEIYRKEYYSFTKYATLIQDLLFNLRMRCSEFDSVPEKILHLTKRHDILTKEYILLLVKLNDSNKNSVIMTANEKDEEILKGIDEVVADIKLISTNKMQQINSYYLNILLGIIIFLFSISMVFGFVLVRKIIIERIILERHINEKSIDLDEAGKKIKLSEEKYRKIVDGSNDVIFTLDDEWNILTINNAMKKYFNINPEKLYFKNFLDLIHEDAEEGFLSRELIKTKLQNFSREKSAIHFKADFKLPHNIESKTMDIRLEYINIEGKQEIFGNAVVPDEDNIAKYITKEKISFQIGNSLITTEEITYRLTSLLSKYLNPAKVKLLRIALREILINAIEHGNLDISFKEKSESLADDNYMKLISVRQRDKKYKDKKVTVDYSIDKNKLICRITDDGNGFDHKKILSMSAEEINDKSLQHGRGINMSRQIFDVIKYNNKGNQVLLVCNFENLIHENTEKTA